MNSKREVFLSETGWGKRKGKKGEVTDECGVGRAGDGGWGEERGRENLTQPNLGWTLISR